MWKRYLVDGPKIFTLWRRWHKTRRDLQALEDQLSSPEQVKQRKLHKRIRDLETQLADLSSR